MLTHEKKKKKKEPFYIHPNIPDMWKETKES